MLERRRARGTGLEAWPAPAPQTASLSSHPCIASARVARRRQRMIGPTSGRGAHDYEADELREGGGQRAQPTVAVAAVMLLTLTMVATPRSARLPWSVPSVAAAANCL